MRKLLTILFTALLIIALAGPAPAASRDMWANVYRLTNPGIDPLDSPITSGITFVVMKTTDGTAETLT